MAYSTPPNLPLLKGGGWEGLWREFISDNASILSQISIKKSGVYSPDFNFVFKLF